MGSAAKALLALSQNKFRSAVRIILNLIVPKADHQPALAFEKCGTASIVIGCENMLATIQFDRQLCVPACQVEYVRANDQLSRKSRPILAQAQPQ